MGFSWGCVLSSVHQVGVVRKWNPGIYEPPADFGLKLKLKSFMIDGMNGCCLRNLREEDNFSREAARQRKTCFEKLDVFEFRDNKCLNIRGNDDAKYSTNLVGD
jgi:hypothetical protein